METNREVRSAMNLMPLAHLAKFLIENDLITEAEFTKQLSAERVVYQAMFTKVK
jgi:hypothetical protein